MSGDKQRHQWPVYMTVNPSPFSLISVSPGSSIFLQTDGWGVTTVTFHPVRRRYLATFQVRTQAVARSGGKGRAKYKAVGDFFCI